MTDQLQKPEDNPFAAPQTDTATVSSGSILSRVRISMPWEVRIATVLMLLVGAGMSWLATTVGQHSWILTVPVVVLILIGFFRANHLARSAAQGIGILIAGVAFVLAWGTLIWGRMDGELFNMFILIMFFVVPFTMWYLLDRKQALAFFGLVCPTCNSDLSRPTGFRANIRRCRNCGAVWK